MRKILITNDDGIDSEGLVRLAEAATEFGEVWVVAPDGQRSAMSHCATFNKEITVWPVDFPVDNVKAFACDGKPADCARVGILNIVPGRPDFVFSGINYGYNISHDLQYSGTAGAAFEAAFFKVQAIAFSEDIGHNHEVTDYYLKEIISKLIEIPLSDKQVHNVNFPGCSMAECKGILFDTKVSNDNFYEDTYAESSTTDGKKKYSVITKRNTENVTEGTDLKAVLDNYVSVGIITNIS